MASHMASAVVLQKIYEVSSSESSETIVTAV